MMDQDWGAGKADPRFLARTLGGNQLEELLWRWEQARVVRDSALGVLDKAAWGHRWPVPGDRARPEE